MDTKIKQLEQELLNTRLSLEQAEVILLNLIRLDNQTGDNFLLPHEDVIVTQKSAIRLLQSSQI
ncbi:hypothetical protein NQT74_14585 [Alteromonas stellipolaris]|uniref:hypothetical protein n=1 Tax=Alteromonas stellipolaris TaxID=233316 RepID=UPI002117F114|nr:hypothetical protein [Alteromonas stellipolaris]MCQ8849811.1 hypothetical protein [Alteromonas stellipolaris]